ncbi:uncharacterized protein N7477_007968 [Penicillium maclennaniae]|uniref:uncharacterized protein n=1 Tax=Penicillium maclennaniae TaxID=1343394 RepID=UPI0025404285|nr:uncharacterized protein N7477_007968 [Penicillium maclennaniae]KAJ5665520.1 hypothetical protein N7477_007968 [Penicillium maclennaniae]
MATSHLRILDDRARDFKVSSDGLLNARKLATGDEDLVVVLIEPTDKAEQVSYTEMLAASPTLLYVNETLQLASGGQRDMENTIILNIRAFRSNSFRSSQSLDDRICDDELAYNKFEQIMSILRPRVAVVCQCATNKANNTFVRDICSSIEDAGDIYLQKLPNGHECLFV